MRKIAICDEPEYNRRLSAFLTRSMPADVMIYTFSSADLLKRQKEEIDLYVMGDAFYKEVESTWKQGERMRKDQIIFIRDFYEDGSYCRWHSPVFLAEMIEERLALLSSQPLMEKNESVRITAIYSPYPVNLKNWVWSHMEPGDLFLGFEDLGLGKEEEPYDLSSKNMGDLCYYIPLREGNIMSILQNVAVCQEGKYYVDSPSWYFDLQGLKEEDYHWFLEEIRKSAAYSHIYVGLGNVAVPSLSFFRMFDDVLLVDHPRNPQIHDFLERLASVSVEEGYMRSEQIQLMDLRKMKVG